MPWYETPAFYYAVGTVAASAALVFATLRFPDRLSRRAHVQQMLPLVAVLLVTMVALGMSSPACGGFAAAAVGLLLAAIVPVQWARMRMLERRVGTVGDPRRGGATLEQLAEASRRTPWTGLYLARRLLDRGCLEEAGRIVEERDDEFMSDQERLMREHLRAAIALRSGWIDDAEQALDRMEPRNDAARNMVAQSRALVLALRGEGTRALRMLEDNPLPRGADPSWRRHRHMAEAHAHASLGDERRARYALYALLEQPGGRERLDKARVEGPATPLVEAVLRGEETPYR